VFLWLGLGLKIGVPKGGISDTNKLPILTANN
jgi:hypothetical protein